MRKFTQSLLFVLMSLLGMPLNSMAETVTYDFAAAAAALEADVTLTASERSAGSNNMGTALVYANELTDLLKDNFGFFFREECTVTLSKEEGGLAMVGSKDTYLSLLNLKAGDKVTLTYTGSVLSCDKPDAEGGFNIEGITAQWDPLNSDQTYTMRIDGNFNMQWKKSKTVITKIVVESGAAAAGPTFNFNALDQAVSSSDSNAGDITDSYVATNGDLTLTVTKSGGTTANRFWGTNNGPQLRVYGGQITIVAGTKAITKVVYNNGKWNTSNAINGKAAEAGEWEGNSTNVVLDVAGNTQINSIEVTTADKTAETTTYSAGEQADPDPITVADALKLIESLGEATSETVVVKGVITSISEISPNYGNATFIISDEGAENALTIYRAKGIDGAVVDTEDYYQVGDVVTMKGKLVNFKGNTPEMTTGGICTSLNRGGQAEETVDLPDGKYYLGNVASELYWGAGNDWGTRASLVKHPEYVTLAKLPDGTYTLESQVSNGGTNYYFNGDYMDNNQPMSLTIKKGKKLGENDKGEAVYAYTIADGDKCFGWDGTTTVLGKELTADSDNAQWIIGTEEDMKASLEEATEEEPADATFLLLDPGFGRNNRNADAWVVSEDCTNKNLSGGNNINNCAESYMSVFTISQTIDVPNGKYILNAQAAVTFHDNREIKEYDGNGYPQIFANDKVSNFNDMIAEDRLSNMGKMSEQFTAGLYAVEPIEVIVTDGKLTIGAKSSRADIWAIWDNFELTYYGPAAEEKAPEIRAWNFTKWSEETVANLKADAAASKTEGWSDVEKAGDAANDADPTETSKDNCFWLAGAPNADGELTANGVVIAETQGLKFNPTYTAARSLAIGVNYPKALSDYAGGAYLWLGGGGKGVPCFTIPQVAAGSTITMTIESHKATDARGVELFYNSYDAANKIGEAFKPTTLATNTWTVEQDADVVVYNTSGCHIYTIIVEAATGENTTYDFAAAAAAGENPANKNGSKANGQAFFGWESESKTDSERQDYKGYEWAEGSVLPEVCHVWRRSDRINGNVKDGGLATPGDREMAIDGLKAGAIVKIYYTADDAATKELLYATGASAGTVATVAGAAAVSGETKIASGAEVAITEGSYFVFKVYKGMVITKISISIPETGLIYNFAKAAALAENPANKNGSEANGQAFYGWESESKTDSKRQDYKGYEWAEGSVLPQACHVWRRSDRINGNVKDGGLYCPNDREMAIDGLQAGSTVKIYYTADDAATKELLYATGATAATVATVDGAAAVSGETTIASGAEVAITEGSYFVFKVYKGMVITKIVITGSVDDPTVGIEDVTATKNTRIEDGAIYNLRGQKVSGALQKGIYIKNGKKFIVK